MVHKEKKINFHLSNFAFPIKKAKYLRSYQHNPDFLSHLLSRVFPVKSHIRSKIKNILTKTKIII